MQREREDALPILNDEQTLTPILKVSRWRKPLLHALCPHVSTVRFQDRVGNGGQYRSDLVE